MPKWPPPPNQRNLIVVLASCQSMVMNVMVDSCDGAPVCCTGINAFIASPGKSSGSSNTEFPFPFDRNTPGSIYFILWATMASPFLMMVSSCWTFGSATMVGPSKSEDA
ncbi:hypothetical protein BJX99DRAFT_218091 [Aspergillus californicus]